MQPTGASSANYKNGPRLLADVGGTNARFALESSPGTIDTVKVYHCADYPGLADAIAAFVKDTGTPQIELAAIAIANPVDGDEVAMTNHDWRFSIEATRRAAGFKQLLVINDFTALALALPHLKTSEVRAVGRGTARSKTVLGLVGPGTGLGVSGLIPSEKGWIPLASEGGHASFAPSDEREDGILMFARRKWPHVSFERLVSGPGIEIIYQALSARNGKASAPHLENAEIVKRALADDALAAETVDCFCGMLGSFAGNVALTLGALGGVYIGGGVVPHLGAFFDKSSFRASFEAKGRFANYLEGVPTWLITAEFPAFTGVSALLSSRFGTD
jgi:glucokinase